MAAATDSNPPTGKRHDEEPASQPPAYYTGPGLVSPGFSGLGSDPSCFQHAYTSQVPLFQANGRQPTTVMVTQPVVVSTSPPPDTTCALILSGLSAILCGFWCGTVGVLLAWKAKLLVLDKKFEHARHTLRIVWFFFAVAMVFGVALWILVGNYLYMLTHWRYPY